MRRLALAVLSLAFLAAGVVALVFRAAPQPVTTELTEEQKATIAGEVNAIHTAFMDAWQANPDDVDRGMSYYLNSPDFTFSRIFSGAEEDQKITLLRGFAAFNDFARSFLEEVADTDWRVTERQFTVLARDVVYVLETGTVVITDTAGVTAPPQSFTYTHVWVHRNGEWKVLLANAGYVL